MIVRILHEGQFELGKAEEATLRQVDEELEAAVRSGDEGAYRISLGRLLALVRQGRRLDDAELRRSDVVVPSDALSFDEARTLFGGDKP